VVSTDSSSGAYVSALELFSIGIGPSSSHTVGPMRAARDFRHRIEGRLPELDRLRVVLHGSLAATGRGHGTPDAVIAGLRGHGPSSVDPEAVHGEWARLEDGQILSVAGVEFTRDDIAFEPRSRGFAHPNALTFSGLRGEEELVGESYLSIGGGFITRVGAADVESSGSMTVVPGSFAHIAELLEIAGERSIAEVAWAYELAMHGHLRAEAGLDAIWEAMTRCVKRGLATDGILPGGLGVPRRAKAAWAELTRRGNAAASTEAILIYAMAVNEENAAGGRVVTAPTNGAAGVLPAVLYDAVAADGLSSADVRTFLLTATAIGSTIVKNASISGAEAGCQAEVGSACAMAAAGLTAVRGGTNEQIENAAEIALEHHLGLTCDPVGGLVQVPCIERNAVAASTAVTASRLALLGDGSHLVRLDTAIETMRQTGADMSSRYKETSLGGLAVNVVEC